MKNVSAFDTPFAPLGLDIWLDQCGLYTFRLSEALENPISAPDKCHTRIHSVDFGAEGVYRTRIPVKPSTSGAKDIQKRSIYCPSSAGRFGFLTYRTGKITKMTHIVRKIIATISVNFGISEALNSSRHSPSAVSYKKVDKIFTYPYQCNVLDIFSDFCYYML